MKTFFRAALFAVALTSTVGAFADDDNDACKEELEFCRIAATNWSCFEKCAQLKSKSCDQNCERTNKERVDECLESYKACAKQSKSPAGRQSMGTGRGVSFLVKLCVSEP